VITADFSNTEITSGNTKCSLGKSKQHLKLSLVSS
jgi:hypothetical protein